MIMDVKLLDTKYSVFIIFKNTTFCIKLQCEEKKCKEHVLPRQPFKQCLFRKQFRISIER